MNGTVTSDTIPVPPTEATGSNPPTNPPTDPPTDPANVSHFVRTASCGDIHIGLETDNGEQIPVEIDNADDDSKKVTQDNALPTGWSYLQFINIEWDFKLRIFVRIKYILI